jgi:hypothetical protein
MKKQALPHVPEATMAALEDVAGRLGVTQDFMVTAATWVFCKTDPVTHHLVVGDFWLRGKSDLEARGFQRRPGTFKEGVRGWLPVAIPPSAAALLAKARSARGGPEGEFSRAQEFVAALQFFAAFPIEARLAIAREYATHLAVEIEPGAEAAASPAPRPMVSKLLAALGAEAGKPGSSD